MRGLWIGLLSVVCSFSQAVEHPIPQPNSYGSAFDGPALALECVGALKTGAPEFPKYFAAKPTAERRVCLDQLFQSLTPEPDFTSDDFFNAISRDPNHNLAPTDPELSLRMVRRIGVNLKVAKAIGSLAAAGLLDDPIILGPLIRCLDYPLISISAICQDTLFTLTRHDFVQPYDFYRTPPNFVRPYNFNRTPPKTEEARRLLIADWKSWQRQMQNGHALFDDWLRSLLLSSLDDLMKRLSAILKNLYMSSWAGTKPRLDLYGPSLFSYSISRDMVAGGWPPDSALTAVSVRAFRPGLTQPDFGMRGVRLNGNPEDTYRERFPFLDLEIDVTVATSDDTQRDASFGAAKEAFDALRRANHEIRP
jgi:hypothetical protein